MQSSLLSLANATDLAHQSKAAVLSFSIDRLKSLSKRFDYDVNLYSQTHHERKAIEAFIQHGFEHTYRASISVTMPMLLAIKQGNFKAALGLRTASSPLFVEQYLDEPIENAIQNTEVKATRNYIVEVGHLYSNHTKFALPLLLTTGISLFAVGQKTVVFCATAHVKKLITQAGIPLVELCQANQQKLVNSGEFWGSYYQTSPSVIAISTSDIVQAVLANQLYLQMFNAMATRIQTVSNRLLEWMQ